MSGRINLLSALLGLQLVVIAAVLFSDTGFGDARVGPFLAFEADAVDELQISAPDDGETVLTRNADGWQLPDGLPADDAKVTQLLTRLAELQAPWPVATSASARTRFEVDEDAYQRHVVLKADGDTVVDLYLGTSPGYQQVHARRAGADAVFSVGLSNYQVPAKGDEWLDKTLLQPRGAITAVAREGAWALQQVDGTWQVDGTAAAQEAAEQLVRRFAELRVMGRAEGAGPDAAAGPSDVFRIDDDEGSYTLSLFGAGEGQPYAVVSSRRDGRFELAAYLADQLLLDGAALLPEDAHNGDEADQGEAADDAPQTMQEHPG